MYSERLVIEVTVNNHPGVMSHITGLFSRRCFNLEGILCGEIGDGSTSRMYLLVKNDNRLEQIMKQIEKLYDVMEIAILESYNPDVFKDIQRLITQNID